MLAAPGLPVPIRAAALLDGGVAILPLNVVRAAQGRRGHG
jgi:hypothetical protein